MLRLVTFLLLLPLGMAYAQTIKVSPSGYVTTGLGGTLQYTATVTGLSNTAVTWYAGGTKGGNLTAGTINANGLYTAPTSIPGQNPVTITARSQAMPTLSASVYMTLLNAGPVLTSVTPNPMHTGGYTVTLTGTGFLPYATVLNVSNGSPVQLSTSSVTSTTIIASGWQANAPNATFTVKNPSSVPSNAVVVPITGGSSSHSLPVVHGAGSGNYSTGTVVNIQANAPPVGQSFVKWTGAAVQNPNSATTTLTMPEANTTVTATYSGGSNTFTLTVNGGSGSGSYLTGTVVPISANQAPQNAVFANWTGAPVANANAAQTTFTMAATNATVTANYSQAAVNIPFPVTTHPRLWITPNDLPRLRGWATSANPVYAQGMAPLLQTSLNAYNSFFPGGVQNANWPDPGDTQGYTGLLVEQHGLVLAFNSLIDPIAANRVKYAQYARNLLMVAMNEAAKGPLQGAPYRDPMFAVYNRANCNGEMWPLIVDWIYNTTDAQNNPILTAADKLTIRNVFLLWANQCINASTCGGDHPSPIGATNTTQLLPGNQAYRFSSNNYYMGHARLLTMMGLCVDPSDDPAVNGALPLSNMGNSLRSYILNANGAWLYQEYAMMGDPTSVAADYGIAGNGAGFGLASGGLPPEGMLYGHSFAYVLDQLWALQTAGFNNVANSGPQIHLTNAPVWDRFVNGYIASLVPTPQLYASSPWLGVTYEFAGYGDLLRLYATEESMQPFALLALLEQSQGLSTHTNAARWFCVNATPGGASNLMTNISQPFSWSPTQSVLYFMLLDPVGQPGSDPRPSMPLNFVDPAPGRIVAHTDWSSNNTMFTYRASWESIYHQDGDAGQFELFRNGEWLTKEMSNYDNNFVGQTAPYHNTLALQNWNANNNPGLNWWELGEWANGGQWEIGMNGGDPVTSTSTGAGYVYASSDLTHLYNRPNIWQPAKNVTDITQATRSIIWLKADTIVVYDRATSIHTGLFKSFNLNFQNAPSINGNVATGTTPKGQHLFVQTLLPNNAAESAVAAAGNITTLAELEPMRYTLTVQDPNKPNDVRFLHVLQGANGGVPITPATYTTSNSGTPFDGAVFGSTAVFFTTNALANVVSTTFIVPGSVHTFMVTGLKAGAFYSVTTQPGPNGTLVTLTPDVGASLADAAGLVTASF